MTKRRKKKSPAPGVTALENGRYRVRVTVTDPRTGRRKDHVKTLPQGATLGEAIDTRDSLRRQMDSQEAPTKRGRPPKLRDCAVDWLAGARVSERTLKAYTERVAHLTAELGYLHLDEIRRHHLQGFAATLEASPLMVRTQREIWGRALQCLRDLWADYEINDCSARVRPPSAGVTPSPAGRALSEEGLANFLKALSEEDAETRSAVLMCALTGLRRSEVVRARRDEIDLEEGWYNVTVSKSQAGLRRIPLVVELVDALGAWLEIAPDSEWMWPSSLTSYGHKSTKWLRTSVLRVGERAKLGKVRPHDLRRTLVTLLDRAGVNRLAVRALAGHTSDKVTDIYSRVSDEDRRAALRVLPGGGVGGRCGTSEPSDTADTDGEGAQRVTG